MTDKIRNDRMEAIRLVRRILTDMELEAQEEIPCQECLDVQGGNIVQILFAAFSKEAEMEKYLVCLQYRNALGKVVQYIHPVPFDVQTAAELAMPELCEKHRAMGWIVAIPVPEFRPPFKLVKDQPEQQSEVIDGGKIII